MTPLQTFLAGVKTRLENATPGPWAANSKLEIWASSSQLNNAYVCIAKCSVHAPVNESTANYELIASAPTDLTAAIQIIEIQAAALREVVLHYEQGKETGGHMYITAHEAQADVDRLLTIKEKK